MHEMAQSERYRPPRSLSPKQRLFLTALARVGQIKRACTLSRISRRMPYVWQKNDPTFAAALSNAKTLADEFSESEIDRQALKAVRPDLFDFDFPQYTAQQILAELRRAWPEKYGDIGRD